MNVFCLIYICEQAIKNGRTRARISNSRETTSASSLRIAAKMHDNILQVSYLSNSFTDDTFLSQLKNTLYKKYISFILYSFIIHIVILRSGLVICKTLPIF